MPTALIVASSRASACGLDFERRALVGIFLQRARIDKLQFHWDAPFRVADTADRGSFSVFFSEDIPRPAERTGRCNCLSSIPARQAKRGYQPCEGRRGRDREPGG